MSATALDTGGSALISPMNDHWRVWGNEFKDTGYDPPINLTHAIYASDGASDLDIGWNNAHDLMVGHVFQVHTDAVPGGPSGYLFTDVRIHDNVITAKRPGDCRGINIGNGLGGSYGSIYNNILTNIGQSFSGIAIYSGDWNIYNNTFYNILGSGPSGAMVWIQGTGVPVTATVRNNIFYSDGVTPYINAYGSASMGEITLSNNVYYNHGSGPTQDGAAINANPLFVDPTTSDFRLRSGSPAIDTGSFTVNSVVVRDREGTSRPQGAAFDIGAYER